MVRFENLITALYVCEHFNSPAMDAGNSQHMGHCDTYVMATYYEVRWRLKRGTEQVAERRNEATEQLQIVEEPVMNGTRVQRGYAERK